MSSENGAGIGSSPVKFNSIQLNRNYLIFYINLLRLILRKPYSVFI